CNTMCRLPRGQSRCEIRGAGHRIGADCLRDQRFIDLPACLSFSAERPIKCRCELSILSRRAGKPRCRYNILIREYNPSRPAVAGLSDDLHLGINNPSTEYKTENYTYKEYSRYRVKNNKLLFHRARI